MIAPLEWTRVEITSGILSGPTRHDRGDVVELDWANIGRRIFFVDAVESDGGRIGLCDGFEYAAAIIEAEEVGREADIPVVDLVVDGP
jgi:hypothetical protein